ncbi:MAG: hypothetical protein K8I30_01245, partial [Anaerolineae bacterium]|nr:hypothetical protein [Anaerolineae bacterium]
MEVPKQQPERAMEIFDTFNDPRMLHAAIVHMPIALAVLGVPLLCLSAALSERHTFRTLCFVLYGSLAAMAFITIQTGDRARDVAPNTLSQEVWDVMELHETLANYTWMLALAVTVFLAFSYIKYRPIRVAAMVFALLAALITGVLVSSAAHFGGQLVYVHGVGTPYMNTLATKPPVTPVLPEEAATDPAPVLPGTEPGEDTPATGGETSMLVPEPVMMDDYKPALMPLDLEEAKAVSYDEDVWPLLEMYCIECHGEDEIEGEYDMRTLEGVVQGGAKAGQGVIPGDPDNSPVVQYIRGVLTPQMPKGDLPLTDEELHVIRQWIYAAGPADSQADLTSVTEEGQEAENVAEKPVAADEAAEAAEEQPEGEPI